MATIRLILKTDYESKSGKYPLNIVVRHAGERRQYSIGITISKAEWDNKTKSIIAKDVSSRATRARVTALMSELDLAITRVEMNVRKLKLRLSDYLPEIEKVLHPDDCKQDGMNFVSRLVDFASGKLDSTGNLYLTTLSRIRAFDKKADRLTFDDIDRNWLKRFNDFMATTSNSQNYRNIHLRNIRAVFNDAISDGITENYPFRRFKLHTEPTAKRDLDVHRLRLLMDYPCCARLKEYVKVFMLQFFLLGINMIDLFNLKDASGGRIRYQRYKTGHHFDIKVEPEAMALIESLRGKKNLLNIADRYVDHKNYLSHINHALKKIGRTTFDSSGKTTFTPLFPSLSTYWSRHTWASIASDLDIPDETICFGLGHSSPYSTTSIYIHRAQRKVDEANRKVIDWVVNGVIDGETVEEPGTPEYYGLSEKDFYIIMQK